MDQSNITENDLQKAKELLAQSGASLVVVSGTDVLYESGKGVLPLLRVVLNVDPKLLQGAVLADKVIGQAAAFMAVKAQFRSVYSPVMSVPAKELLEKHGILAETERLVPNILRPDNQLCLMERTVAGAASAEEAVGRLVEFFQSKEIPLTRGEAS